MYAMLDHIFDFDVDLISLEKAQKLQNPNKRAPVVKASRAEVPTGDKFTKGLLPAQIFGVDDESYIYIAFTDEATKVR